MYRRILVPLEHSDYDATILDHVRKLARHCASELVLIHVADGWAARNIRQLALRESEEMRGDRKYIEQQAAALAARERAAQAGGRMVRLRCRRGWCAT